MKKGNGLLIISMDGTDFQEIPQNMVQKHCIPHKFTERGGVDCTMRRLHTVHIHNRLHCLSMSP